MGANINKIFKPRPQYLIGLPIYIISCSTFPFIIIIVRNNDISVDIRHVHRGEVRFVHIGRMSWRVHVNQRISVAGHWRSVVRQCMGIYRLLQWNPVDKPHSYTIQTLRTGKNTCKLFIFIRFGKNVVQNQIKTFFMKKKKINFSWGSVFCKNSLVYI